MRNGGVRRVALPYKGAPDGWYPLGDTMIEKLKPAYVQQMYGSETIASFVSMKQQDEDMTSAASYWYDYQLKQRSNFERTMFVAIDQMLEQAFTPIKVYFDARCKRMAFDQIDPLHLIVPDATEEYNQNGGTDWMVHILHMSVQEYRADDKFKQDDDFIERIKGKGRDGMIGSADTGKQSTIDQKEGINCSANKNEIVLWEVHRKDRKQKKITIEIISPMLPCEDNENVVRAEFGSPYNKGIFKGGQTFPFVKIRQEIKGKGHYSSRGIIEINVPFESSLTRSLNMFHEHMDFSARPQYENSGASPIPNASNVKTRPGSILPPGLKLAVHPGPPLSLREDMDMMRSIAEDRTQVPDLSSGEHVSGTKGKGGNPTATQINAVVGQSGQGNDMRARVFRLDLGEILKMGWAIASQYLVGDEQDQTSLQFIVDNEIRTLDKNAVHEEYEITPNGSADSWNKGALVSKRMAYFQSLQANPFIDQGELTKWLLEADDPRMVKRLYRDPGSQQQDQMEEQATEIGLMLLGFPAQVHPADDDKTHLQCLTQFVERRLTANEPITPEFARLALQHGSDHHDALLKKKDPATKQIEAQVMPIVQILGQIAQSDQPPNVIQMQQPGAPGGPPQASLNTGPQGPGAATPSSQDKPSAVGNAMASLMKAGAPITRDDISAWLASVGYPPLPPEAPGAAPAVLPQPPQPLQPLQSQQPIPQPAQGAM